MRTIRPISVRRRYSNRPAASWTTCWKTDKKPNIWTKNWHSPDSFCCAPCFPPRRSGRFAAYSAGAAVRRSGEPIGEVENELVTMRRGSDDSSVVLEVAGFGLTLGRASDTETGKHREVKSYPRVCGVFCDGIELGFNTLVGLDYAGYPGPERRIFSTCGPAIRSTSASRRVGLDIDLDRKRKFGFSTGLRYTVR